ncbi:MAG: phosphatase PAP2 family protein [Oscillospiraceae bacterium]
MTRVKKAFITLPLVLFLAVAIPVGANITHAFDEAFYQFLMLFKSPVMTIIMLAFSRVGDGLTVMLILMVAVFLEMKSPVKFGRAAVASVVISTAFNFLIKAVVSRERPTIEHLTEAGGYSFPSGHAMNNMALYAMLFLCLWLMLREKKTIRRWLFALFLMPVMIALSRVYLGVHFISDVVAGMLLGLFIAMLVFIVFNKKGWLEDKSENT